MSEEWMCNAFRPGHVRNAFPLLSVERQVCVLNKIPHGDLTGRGRGFHLIDRLQYICQLFLGLGLRHFGNPAQDLAFLAPLPRGMVFPVLAYPVPTILGFSYTTILKPLSHVTPLAHSAHGLHF